MKSLDLFLSKIVRDCMKQENSPCSFLSLSNIGKTKLKLLPYKGDESVIPHSQVFLHYVKGEVGHKVGIICHGKKCELCAIAKANSDLQYIKVSAKYLFYCEHDEQLKVILAPQGFVKALYGDIGRPSEVVQKLREGVNVFSLIEGRELEVNREYSGTIQDFFIRVLDSKKTSEKIQGQLRTAVRLEDIFKTLNVHDMKSLANKILTGGNFDASDYKKVI